MPKKLTQEEYIQRVKNCVGEKFTVVSEYQGKEKPIILHCNIHNVDFSCSASCFMRQNDIRANCPECAKELKKVKSTAQSSEVICSYCGKSFMKPNSKLNGSKSGLYFCCREHKDLAQKVSFGLKEIQPSHYGTTIKDYRKIAFNFYPHECSVCKYKEDNDILEVHHIDENHFNNEPSNLIILCPLCHRKLTSQKYKLINKEQILLKES